MKIDLNEEKGHYVFEFKDKYEYEILKGFHRLRKGNQDKVRMISAKEKDVTHSIQNRVSYTDKRLVMMVETILPTPNLIFGTTPDDDKNLRALHKSMQTLRNPSFIVIGLMFSGRIKLVEIAVTRCKHCKVHLISEIECRDQCCVDCFSLIRIFTESERRFKATNKIGVINIIEFRELKSKRSLKKQIRNGNLKGPI